MIFFIIGALLTAPTPERAWLQLIDSRIYRDSARLKAEEWTAQNRSNLALQEYLMTLGQNGDPAFLERIQAYFEHPRLQATALLAYGEVDGAPLKPLLDLNEKVAVENRALWLEALAKLAKPADHETINKVWTALDPEMRNRAGYYFWRAANEALTAQILAKLNASASVDDDGYAYYLFRSRTQIEPDLLAALIAVFKGRPQALIHATRIQTTQTSDRLTAAMSALCRYPDWRIRSQAISNLSGEAAAVAGLALLSDPNPNVVRAAGRILVGLRDERLDRSLTMSPTRLTACQTESLVSAADPKQFPNYFPLVEDWRGSKDIWKARKFIAFLAITEDPADGAWLREIVNGADSGRAVLALNALGTRGEPFTSQLVAQALAGDDVYLLSAAVTVLAGATTAGNPSPFRDQLLQLAQKQFAEVDFHYSFIQGMNQLLAPEEVEEQLEKLRHHPDYLVRLGALNATASAGLEMRHGIFAGGWSHQVPEPVRRKATEFMAAETAPDWIIETAKGKVVIDLRGSYAPITCANIVHLSGAGYFDGMPIHRVVPNFVVQGGDNRGDGSGGPGYSIPCEVNALRYVRGAVGMALAGKDTGGSQFFICHSDQPHLDGGYTVFGQVTSGMDVVDKLEEGDLILRAYTQR